MTGTRSVRGGVAVFVAVCLLGACGAGTHAPEARTARTESQDAGADADDESIAEGEPDASSEEEVEAEPRSPCPTNMVLVASGEARFCVDKYEASLVEIDGEGKEKPFPHWLPVDGHVVRAVSEPDVFPQGFISEVQAEDACTASGKRLCSHVEWKTACMGPSKTTFPYGNTRQAGVCHDTGKSAVLAVFGARMYTDPVAHAATSKPPPAAQRGAPNTAARGAAPPKPGAKATAKPNRQAHATIKGRAAETTRPRATRPGARPSRPAPSKRPSDNRTVTHSTRRTPAPPPAKASARPASVEPSVWTQLNDPRLGQVDGALAKTGSHGTCANTYGALDMVGNIHEWVKTDPSAVHGTFAGGYYLDTTLNGDGCQYRTTAHAHDYHDYSTGFRCCAEASATE